MPPCSHPALSTVHHRPRPNTGTAPLAPNRRRAGEAGARRHGPPMPIFPRANISQPVEDDAGADDERHEAEVAAEHAQRWSEAPHPGIAAAAVVARVVVDPDEHAARRAEQGTFADV